ncbi:MAG: hypothetical protein NVS2B5_10200 [Beijerinckiaceae bacterium]
MPTAIPTLYATPVVRPRRMSESFAVALLFALMPIGLAMVCAAATHNGRLAGEDVKAILLQAGDALSAAEMPRAEISR